MEYGWQRNIDSRDEEGWNALYTDGCSVDNNMVRECSNVRGWNDIRTRSILCTRLDLTDTSLVNVQRTLGPCATVGEEELRAILQVVKADRAAFMLIADGQRPTSSPEQACRIVLASSSDIICISKIQSYIGKMEQR